MDKKSITQRIMDENNIDRGIVGGKRPAARRDIDKEGV